MLEKIKALVAENLGVEERKIKYKYYLKYTII